MNNANELRLSAVWALFLALGGCAAVEAPSQEVDAQAAAVSGEVGSSEAFRIDLSQVDVTFDFDPTSDTVSGHALLSFRMRPGQTRPLFHFDPELETGTARSALTSVQLNGESIEIGALKRTRFFGSSERGFEIQRDLEQEELHELEVRWEVWNWINEDHPGWFRTDVDDILGVGNEALWPTINSPEELARHTVRLVIHSEDEYWVVGSGAVSHEHEGSVQIWDLDSEQEIASYTMMFAAMPAADVSVEEFEVAGVPVTITSTEGEGENRLARAIAEGTLSALVEDFGEFPMSQMQILLLEDWDTGMEYYGATMTDVASVEHELTHMYWGCSAIARTWRDTWIDEAIDTWWCERDDLESLPAGFTSDIVGGRSVIEPAFSKRAYEEGAQLFVQTAEAMGGDQALIDFLAEFHARWAFTPFTTEEFIDELVEETGREEFREEFRRALYAD